MCVCAWVCVCVCMRDAPTGKDSSLVFMPFLFATVMGVKFHKMYITENITPKAMQEIAKTNNIFSITRTKRIFF